MRDWKIALCSVLLALSFCRPVARAKAEFDLSIGYSNVQLDGGGWAI